jgi:uncharacterized protein
MKYLIWLLVILLAFLAFKRSRRVETDAPKAPPPASPAPPANMAVCLHCGIHLPHDEAVTGEKGLYCSTEHRTTALDSNPV